MVSRSLQAVGAGEPALLRRRAVLINAGLVAAAAGLLLARGPVVALVVMAVVAAGAALILDVNLAALAFVALAPFEGYAKSFSGSAVKAFGAVLFAAWLVRALSSRTPGKAARLAHPAVVAAGALLAVLLVSTLIHQNGALGTEVLIRYLSYIAAFVVLVDCMQDRLSPQRVARVYVAACSIAAVFGLIAFFRGNLRASGPVGDPNDFAFFLVAALPLCLALRHDARRRHLYDAAALLIFVAILATLSRGALLGIAAMLVFAGVTHRISGRLVISVLVLAGVAVLATSIIAPDKLSSSLHAKNVVAEQNVEERLIRWETAAEMTYDHPLFGLGPAGFRENYDRYIDYRETNLQHPLDVAHEMYLEVSSELGLTGLAALLGVLGFGYRAARLRSLGDDADARLAGGVAVALAGVAVAAIFLTEQYYLPVWLLAALGTALQANATHAGLKGDRTVM